MIHMIFYTSNTTQNKITEVCKRTKKCIRMNPDVITYTDNSAIGLVNISDNVQGGGGK